MPHEQDSGPPPGTRPRHEAGNQRAVVRNTNSDEVIGEIYDASRAGMRVAVAEKIEVGTEFEVRIEYENEILVASRQATVRWTRPGDNGEIFAGFMFDKILAWEEIGELFLTGALQTNHPKMISEPGA